MAEIIVPAITALQAQSKANYFLLTHLGDRFVADDPVIDADAGVWRVPVLLAYPLIGPMGNAGVILVNSDSEEIVFYTPLEDMKAAARALYETHRDEIEASVPEAGNSLLLFAGMPSHGFERLRRQPDRKRVARPL